MTNDRYEPVSCAAHSEYELTIMQQQKMLLSYDDVKEEVRPVDIITRNHAEYLVFINSQGEQKEVRLDKIAEAHAVA